MPDIFHSFQIAATAERIFETVSTPEGLDQWWTQTSKGKPALDQTFELNFGPAYQWKAVVTKINPDSEFEFTIKDSDPDWFNTKVGFALQPDAGITNVNFYHTGWPKANEHYRISSFCWAMYLRLLKRYIEFGEKTPYEKRLDV
jgi:uncharacterized protein YndB with AHSA1/START domain